MGDSTSHPSYSDSERAPNLKGETTMKSSFLVCLGLSTTTVFSFLAGLHFGHGNFIWAYMESVVVSIWFVVAIVALANLHDK